MTAGSAQTRRPRAVDIFAVGLALVLGACTSATTPTSSTATATPNGTAVPGDTTVLVALALQTDMAGLASFVTAAVDPANPAYHQYIDLATVADRFGAPAQTVSADIAALAAMGVTVTADPTRSALWGQVSASTIATVFGTTLVSTTSGADQIIEPSRTPSLPAGLSGVTGAVGFARTTQLGPPPTPSGATTCPPASEVATAASLSSLFGFDTLAGSDGSGTTAALFTVGTYEPAALAAYEACTGDQLAPANVAAAATPLAPPAGGGTEAALDTLLLQTIAPAAHVDVTHIDPNVSIVFPLLNLFASNTTPEAIIFTLGYCEAQLAPVEVALAEWLLASAAATGTTTAAASGDSGSTACPDSTAPTVQYPGSSAYVVSVGGAQYSGTATAPTGLQVWNDSAGHAGGGGSSTIVPRPSFQTSGGQRQVPDIAALAEPTGIGAIPVCTADQSASCVWSDVGGTSAGVAVLSAAGLIYGQRHADAGAPARWGLLAPAIYRAADQQRVTDITSGTNQTTPSSCCTATLGYDQASGLGLFSPDQVGPLYTAP